MTAWNHQGEPERVPNPELSITVGRSWQVRPTVLLTTNATMQNAMAIQDSLRRSGYWSTMGLASGERNIDAITGTIVIDADSPGQAADTAIARVASLCESLGLTVEVLQEVVVVPAWRDERDW